MAYLKRYLLFAAIGLLLFAGFYGISQSYRRMEKNLNGKDAVAVFAVKKGQQVEVSLFENTYEVDVLGFLEQTGVALPFGFELIRTK